MSEMIGHNGAPTPFDECKEQVDLVQEQAKQWLDGAEVTNQKEADAIGEILNMARTAHKKSDNERKAEKKPHDDAGKAVQAKYKPLLETCDMVASTCKGALTRYLTREEERKRKEQEELERQRRQAEEEARKAAEEAEKSDNLEQVEEAKRLQEEAAQKAKESQQHAKQKVQAATSGRAVSTRTTYSAEIEDLDAAVKHYWQVDRQAFVELVQKLADADVKAKRRSIPGIKVVEHKTVA